MNRSIFPLFSDLQEPNSGHVRKPSHSSSTADDSWMADKEIGMLMHTHMRGTFTHAMCILVLFYLHMKRAYVYMYIRMPIFGARVCAHVTKINLHMDMWHVRICTHAWRCEYTWMCIHEKMFVRVESLWIYSVVDVDVDVHVFIWGRFAS